mgnify:CR=1 FL=1
MKKNRLPLLISIVAAGLCILLFSGCSSSSGETDSHYTAGNKVIIKVSMYNNSAFPQWRTYVEKQCPDVYIEWENNLNSAANVIYQAKHDDMPDIVTIRRFESDSASEMDKYLSDLSELKITDTYKPKYLKPYQNNGKQYWLPGPGVIDGPVANTAIFKKYGLEYPDDIDSFIDVCSKLEKHGLTAFDVAGKDPWTPTALVEGFGLSPFLTTARGSDWLDKFKNGTVDSVDAAGFAKISRVLRRLSDAHILTEKSLSSDSAAVEKRLIASSSAMSTKNSDAPYDPLEKNKYMALPFFGSTADKNCLFTYPVFSLAMSRELQSDPARLRAGKEVISAMLSADAQKILNNYSEGLISYNKNIKLKRSSSMKNIEPLIKKDKCFIRTLNSNSFAANAAVLTAVIENNADDTAFTDILNENLFKKIKVQNVAESNIEANNKLNTDTVSSCASVIAQLLQKGAGTDCALIDSDEATAPIYKGTYTTADIAAITTGSSIYTGRLTGRQIRSLVRSTINYATTFQSGNIEPLIEYPAVAGLHIDMKKDGTVTSIQDSSSSRLNSDSKYTIAVSGNIYNALTAENSSLARSLAMSDKNLLQYFTDTFRSDSRLPDPQDYITVH